MIRTKHILLTLSLLLCNVCIHAATVDYSVRGKIIDKQSRQPVAYANVVVVGIPGKGASTDSLGMFRIEQVTPGIDLSSCTNALIVNCAVDAGDDATSSPKSL